MAPTDERDKTAASVTKRAKRGSSTRVSIPAAPARLSLSPSGKSSSARRRNSVVYFHKPSLGDKLQRLALRAPQYLAAVELLVDLILARVSE